jgi:hypothetical protein
MMILPSFFILLQLSCIISFPINTEDQWRELADGKCFLKVTKKMNWIGANDFCKSKSARLVTPFLLNDESIIKKVFMGSNIGSDYYWTALTRTGTVWRWSDSLEKYVLPSFALNFDTTKNCGSVSPVLSSMTLTPRYYAFSCTDLKEFFCERVCGKLYFIIFQLIDEISKIINI